MLCGLDFEYRAVQKAFLRNSGTNLFALREMKSPGVLRYCITERKKPIKSGGPTRPEQYLKKISCFICSYLPDIGLGTILKVNIVHGSICSFIYVSQ